MTQKGKASPWEDELRDFLKDVSVFCSFQQVTVINALQMGVETLT
jgi:hypothetical protein